MAVILSERAGGRHDGRLQPQLRSARRSMGAVLERAARSIGQVALFGVFGLFGLSMTAVVVPLSRVVVRDPVHRANGIRHVIQSAMRAYIRSLQALRLIDLEIIGLERRIAPGTLLVANHPSLIDALILLSHIDGGVIVAKHSLQVNLFTSGGIAGANYVVNTEAQGLIEECCARLAAGEILVMFPECTRTGADGVIRLRRGAAQIALRSGCPVVPVTMEFSEPLLTKQSSWWLAPRVRPRVRVVQHDTIDPAQHMHGHRSVSLAARRLTEHLQALYTKELARRGPA